MAEKMTPQKVRSVAFFFMLSGVVYVMIDAQHFHPLHLAIKFLVPKLPTFECLANLTSWNICNMEPGINCLIIEKSMILFRSFLELSTLI